MPKKTSKSKTANILTKSELIDSYKKMLLIRRFEEKAGQAYGLGKIGGKS